MEREWRINSSFAVDVAANCVFSRHVGTHQKGAIANFFKNYLDNCPPLPGSNYYLDMTNILDWDAGYQTITEYKLHWQRIDAAVGPCKMAFLVKDDLAFGLGNQIRTVYDTGLVDRRPFKVQKDALKWLGLPDKFIVPPLE